MRIVLAYSGGPATSVAIPWLADIHRAEVIAVTLDLGQGRALEAVRDRALAAGAVRAHVVDVRDEFAGEYVMRSLRADALDDEGSPSPLALGRPLIGRVLVEMARIERADAVAHGCDTAGHDRRRIESAVRALNPGLTVLAPLVESGMSLRDYAAAHHVPMPVPADATFSQDVNLWGCSLTPAAPTGQIPDTAFKATSRLSACPNEPALVEVSFEAGVPTSINGVSMPLIDLIQSLGTIAGAHGVGRVQRGDRHLEAPAAVVLHAAHRALEARVWDQDTRAFAATVSRRYAEIIDCGGWFLPLREALDAFIAHTQTAVSGVIRLKLFRATCEALND